MINKNYINIKTKKYTKKYNISTDNCNYKIENVQKIISEENYIEYESIVICLQHCNVRKR